jgi:hypothetical protein
MNTINNLINSLNMMEPLAQFEVIMLQQDFNIIPYVFLNGFLNNVIISLNFFITENVKNNT